MFKVGDRVRCIGFHCDGVQHLFIRVGDTGTVVEVRDKADGQSILAKWDNPACIECDGTWWINADDCLTIDEEVTCSK